MAGLPPRSLFDRMRRDRSAGGSVASLAHRGCKVQVRVLAESPAELAALLPAAQAFWRARARWFKAFREYAVGELLAPLNDCLDDGAGEPPAVTAAGLRRMLAAPFAVVVGRDDDGRTYFEMSGGKGRALRGHCVEVTGTLDDGITDGDVVALF